MKIVNNFLLIRFSKYLTCLRVSKVCLYFKRYMQDSTLSFQDLCCINMRTSDISFINCFKHFNIKIYQIRLQNHKLNILTFRQLARQDYFSISVATPTKGWWQRSINNPDCFQSSRCLRIPLENYLQFRVTSIQKWTFLNNGILKLFDETWNFVDFLKLFHTIGYRRPAVFIVFIKVFFGTKNGT